MSDQDHRRIEPQAPQPPRPEGSGGTRPNSEPEMPLLAATAAARLTRDILSRVNSPHAGSGPGPLRPDMLWRQVALRLGAMDQAAHRRPAPGVTPGGHSSFKVSHSDLVYRTRSPHAAETEDAWGPGEPLWPQQRLVVPPPAASPLVPPVAPAETAPPVYTASQPPEGTPAPHLEQAGSTPVSEQSAPAAPPVFVPAKVVRVEFVPGPAVEPPQPLAAPKISAPEPTRAIHGNMSRHLHSELNRDIVPTTDLLQRMVYMHDVSALPPPPVASQPVPASPEVAPVPQGDATINRGFPLRSEAVEMTDRPQILRPVGTGRPESVVVQSPPRPATPVEMTFAPPPSRRGRGAQVQEDTAPRGAIGRFFDRVASALPEPVRRVIERPLPVQPEQPAPQPSLTDSVSQDQTRAQAPTQAAHSSSFQSATEAPTHSPGAEQAGSAPSAYQSSGSAGILSASTPVSSTPSVATSEPSVQRSAASDTGAAERVSQAASRATEPGTAPEAKAAGQGGSAQVSSSLEPVAVAVQSSPAARIEISQRTGSGASGSEAPTPAPDSAERASFAGYVPDQEPLRGAGLLGNVRSRIFGGRRPGSGPAPLSMPQARPSRQSREVAQAEEIYAPSPRYAGSNQPLLGSAPLHAPYVAPQPSFTEPPAQNYASADAEADLSSGRNTLPAGTSEVPGEATSPSAATEPVFTTAQAEAPELFPSAAQPELPRSPEAAPVQPSKSGVSSLDVQHAAPIPGTAHSSPANVSPELVQKPALPDVSEPALTGKRPVREGRVLAESEVQAGELATSLPADTTYSLSVDAGPTSFAPAQSEPLPIHPYVPPEDRPRETRLKTLQSRLFGRSSVSGPRPLDMPWVRNRPGRSIPADGESAYPERQFPDNRPGPSLLGPRYVGDDTTVAPQASPQPSGMATPSNISATTSPSEPAQIEQQGTQAATVSGMGSTSAGIEAQGTPSSIVEPELPEVSTDAGSGILMRPSNEQYLETQIAPARAAETSYPGASAEYEVGTPAPSEVFTEVNLPDAVTPPPANQGEAFRPASEAHPSEITSASEIEAWEALPDVAGELMRQHAPLRLVHPLASGGIGGFLGRIFGSGQFRSQGGPSQAQHDGPVAGGSAAYGNLPFAYAVSRQAPLAQGATQAWDFSAEWGVGGTQVVGLAGRIAGRQASSPTGIGTPLGQGANLPLGRATRHSAAQERANVVASVSDTANPGIAAWAAGASTLPTVRTVGQMSSSFTAQDDSVGESGAEEAARWSDALYQIYGREAGQSDMPLANPYQTFAVLQSDTSPYEGIDGSAPGIYAGAVDAGSRSSNMYVPARRYAPGEQTNYTPSAEITDFSWGQQGDSDGGEASSWADVVTSAVNGPQTSASPALAMSANERAESHHDSEHQEEEGAAKGGTPELEDLAETIYGIIRHRLMIENERSW